MKTFEIYEHPTSPIQAVKYGFSWPACLFTWIWALYKKLWCFGLAYFLVLLFTDTAIPMAAPLVSIIGCLAFGYQGNKLVRQDLNERGFTAMGTIEAANPDAALALYSRSQE